ncbi:MAG: ferritin-like domain-containing protein, partial [Bacteroidales bacterium]
EVKKVTEVKPMLEMASKMENTTIMDYNKYANECAQNADSATKKIFEDLVVEEENHCDQFDNEIENLNNFGDNYLVLQSMEHSKNIANGTPAE